MLVCSVQTPEATEDFSQDRVRGTDGGCGGGQPLFDNLGNRRVIWVLRTPENVRRSLLIVPPSSILLFLLLIQSVFLAIANERQWEQGERGKGGIGERVGHGKGERTSERRDTE